MHKIIYNACYGGFSLSMSAIAWLEAHCEDIELEKLIEDNLDKGSLHAIYTVSDWFNKKRHHKDLISVVESLGDKANGSCARLRVTTIDSNQYRISEYDGYESVITPDNEEEWIVISE